MLYVFKTSVTRKKHIKQLSPLLNDLLPGCDWNFDLQDCDNILRINSNENIVAVIINLLNTNQFYCSELEY